MDDQEKEALAKAKAELEVKDIESISELQLACSKLRQTEEKYRLILENAAEGIIVIDLDGRFSFVSVRAADQLGYTVEEMLGKPVSFFVDRQYRRKLKARLENRKIGIADSYELKCRRKEGSELWIKVNGSPIYDDKGQYSGSLGLLTDITEEKRLKYQLQTYAHRITQIQEEERKRIAYELHDDTAQYLSILKLQLDSLLQSGKIQDPEVIEKLQYLEKDAERAFNDVRRYSHELRPSVLEHQGLMAALKQIVEDINILQQFTVRIDVEGIEPDLSEEVKLGLFRIAQEALNNTRKHAKAANGTISLHYRRKLVRMIIADDGVGFNVREALTRNSGKGSLGLTSIQERAKLIGADLKIDSQSGKGTTVTVEMPL